MDRRLTVVEMDARRIAKIRVETLKEETSAAETAAETPL